MLNTQRTLATKLYDLLSSMRFAVSLLTILGIASIIGTVLVQNQPYNNYIIKFGQFWFGFFEMLGLYDVYHSSWFLLILVFLVLSTGMCVYRNAPVMIKEWRSFKEQVTEKSFGHMSHQATYSVAGDQTEAKNNVLKYLAAKGYQYKIKPQDDGSELVAAKAGTHQRLGYIFTHTAIIVICLGGLMDGSLPFKIQELMGEKKIETRLIPVAEIGDVSRLGSNNLSFRGNMNLPEGEMSNVAFLNIRDGYMVQELPFAIELKKFKIEHYATGQPKDFESEILIHDKSVAEPVAAKVKVNHPFIYKGIAIYQSDFRDGGTELDFKFYPIMEPQNNAYPAHGKVFEKGGIGEGDDEISVEYNDFRKFNILNLSPEGKGKPQNVGPNVTFKLRDVRGQAKEYVNYMQPLPIDGNHYFVTGVRSTPQEEFKYLRIPVDPDFGIDGFMAFRYVMMNPDKQDEIAHKLADIVMAGKSAEEKETFSVSTKKLLSVFAQAGYDGMTDAIEQSVPKDQQSSAAKAYIKMLGLAAFEAYNIGLESLNKDLLAADKNTETLVLDSLSAFSDIFYFGSPYYFQLEDYQHKQASGFQLTRSPGQFWVYLGSCLLVLGIFAMLYIKERRIWLLLKPESNQMRFAMSSNRKNLDFDQEYAVYEKQLAALVEKNG